MQTLMDWLMILLPFAGLVLLWVVSMVREKQRAERLYRFIEEGSLSEVQSLLSKQAFPNLRTLVVARSIERAVEARQPAVLDYLLSTDLKLVTSAQKLGSFLYEQSLRGGWRGLVLWRFRTAHQFEPWRDLSKKDKSKLRNRASRGGIAEASKAQLRHELGRWTVS